MQSPRLCVRAAAAPVTVARRQGACAGLCVRPRRPAGLPVRPGPRPRTAHGTSGPPGISPRTPAPPPAAFPVLSACTQALPARLCSLPAYGRFPAAHSVPRSRRPLAARLTRVWAGSAYRSALLVACISARRPCRPAPRPGPYRAPADTAPAPLGSRKPPSFGLAAGIGA